MGLSKREKQLLWELSKNSREQQSEIAKKLKISPQTCKYAIDRLREQKVFKETAVFDPARLGLITIRAFLSFLTFNKHTQQEILESLCDQEDVVLVQRLKLGADVLVEYAVPNLSYFNKTYTAFLDENSDAIRNKKVYPVLVRYSFKKTYLYSRARDSNYSILSGDRAPAQISQQDMQVFHELIKDSSAAYAQIARRCEKDPRTVHKAIYDAQRDKIIRGFDIDINYKQAGISSAILGVQFSYVANEEMDRFVEFAASSKEIVSLFKVIGDESVFVTIETLESYTEVIDQIRSEFKIIDYSVFEAGNIVKNTYIPHTNAFE